MRQAILDHFKLPNDKIRRNWAIFRFGCHVVRNFYIFRYISLGLTTISKKIRPLTVSELTAYPQTECENKTPATKKLDR